MGLKRNRGDARGDAGGGRGGRWFAVAFFLALFLLLGGLYAAGYAFTNGRVPRNVSVAGVEIGGMTVPRAENKLQRTLVPRTGEPILARHGKKTYRVDPATAGLRLDVQETVANAGGGRSLDPRRMIHVLTGGEDIEPVVHVDDSALDGVVSDLADKVRRRAKEGAVRFVRGRVEPVYPTPGQRLDEDATADALTAAFVAEEREVELSVQQVPTRISHRDVTRAVQRFAEPAMSGPVVLKAGGSEVRLRPAMVGSALSMQPRGGELAPRIDAEKLQKRAVAVLARVTERPRPATVRLRDGRPRVVRGENGTAVDTSRLGRRLLRVLTERGDDRTVRLRLETVRPEFDVRDARKLRIKEVVSSFTTYFPHSDYRNQNLGRAAEKINGTVLRPGEIFSLNDVVGERTAENGFTKGFIISDGVLVEDFGGGVSQVATTTYNAAFFAGLKDIEHHPHSLYFDRYPMGREATVAWGALDLRFQNNTPYGVLVQSWIQRSTPSSEGEMHVRMWSTDYWHVEAGLSEQYDFTQPDVRYNPSDKCVEQTGSPGFEVDVFRRLYRDGERVRSEKDHVVYDAIDTVHCRPAPGSR